MANGTIDVSVAVNQELLKVLGKWMEENKRLEMEVARLQLHVEGRWIRGGDGSHWEGCEEVHWDCKIVKLQEEIKRLGLKLLDAQACNAELVRKNGQMKDVVQKIENIIVALEVE